jgi:NAD(P)H-dependent flavin oxidoreductase YrpB (nitropropane dioxygenase family)
MAVEARGDAGLRRKLVEQTVALVEQRCLVGRSRARLAQPDATFADVAELVNGKAGRELLETGDLTKGVFWAGMVQGLIHDIPSCQELIDRIIAEAEAVLDQRLAGFRA